MALDHCYWVFVRRSTDTTSDYPVLKREFQPEKYALWYTIRPFVWRLILTPSDNPVPQTIFQPVKQALCRMLRVKIRAGISRGRIIRLLCPDSPTLWVLDYPTPLSFPISILLTWNWFECRFFLLPSVFLRSIAGLELILSKCARNLRPTLWMIKLPTLNPPL